MPYKRLNADIPTQLSAAWAMLCEIQGYTKSDRTRQLILEDLENFVHTPVLPEFKPFQKCVKEVLEQWKQQNQ